MSNIPEVVVKISAFLKRPKHILAHFDYISRRGTLPLRDEWGNTLHGRPALKTLHQEWLADLGPLRANARHTCNVVLSLPAGYASTRLLTAAEAFAVALFAENHQYVLALHVDTPHPHVHLCIKCYGFDGRKLDPRKDDLLLWRDTMVDCLADVGIITTATRRPRGVADDFLPQARYWAKIRGQDSGELAGDKS